MSDTEIIEVTEINNADNTDNADNTKIPVKVGITNHVFSDFNSTDKTVTLNFKVPIYEVKELIKHFKLSGDEEVKKFNIPFHLQNRYQY